MSETVKYVVKEKQRSKRVRKEEQLYEPILKALKSVFEAFVNKLPEAKEKTFKNAYSKGEVHLEITANKHFTERLKEPLDDKALSIIRVEGFYPDIMGFIQRDTSSLKELITVEVKEGKITIKNIAKAKLYQDIFRANYGMLISPKRISEEIRRFILDRFSIRGNLLIAQFNKNNETFVFDPKLYNEYNLPEPFKTEEVIL